MKIFIIIGSFHALYLSFLTIRKKRKVLADYLLTLILFLLFIIFGIVYYSFEWNLPILQLLIWNISLLISPIIYLYAISLTQGLSKFKKKWVLFFIPYLLSVLHLIITIINTNDSEIGNVFKVGNMFHEISILHFFMWLDLFSIPIYFLLILMSIKLLNIKLLLNFSNLKNRNLDWLKHLILGILFIWVITNSLFLFNFSTEDRSLLIGFSISSVFIFYIGFYALNQNTITFETSINNEKNKISPHKNIELDLLANKVKLLMLNDKPYLNNDLSLYNLSKLLNVTTHDLSQLLNKKFNQNFYAFINSYRINEFKARIMNDDWEKFTILSIAFECGFNSKSSFNRIFKSSTGQTPLGFIKIMKNKSQSNE